MEKSSTDFALLSESLMEPSTPSRADPNNDTNPTPLRYFFSDHNGGEEDASEDGEEEEDSVETVDREKHLQLVALRILGKPFQRTFWFRDWPIAALLGALLGIFTLAFLAAVHGALDLWFSIPDNASGPNWMWLAITTGGAFLCGVLLLLPQAPSVGTVRTMYHDAMDLKVCILSYE
jgi:hypothetical protein